MDQARRPRANHDDFGRCTINRNERHQGRQTYEDYMCCIVLHGKQSQPVATLFANCFLASSWKIQRLVWKQAL